MLNKKADLASGLLFLGLSISFIAIAMGNENFLNWVFERHHNQLSWYIRPLFLIPFCFFAYKKSFAGIGVTVLATLTSMFWFPVPESVPEKVYEFLAMEVAYLQGSWDLTRVIFTLFIPVTFSLLAYALWQRKLRIGLYIVIFMAFIKIAWSIMEGGESGSSIIVPALLGLALTLTVVYMGFRLLEKRKSRNQ